METSPSETPRVYRPGATLFPLLIWAALMGSAAGLALHTAFHRAPGSQARWVAILLAALSIVFGPLGFLAHLARAWFMKVSVDPERGLVLAGGRMIPWGNIRSIELRRASFEGLLRPSPILIFTSGGCLLLIYYVVLPSFALFTPWHRRVLVRLADGEVMVFHDLAYADQFVRDVEPRISPSTSGRP